MKRRSVVALVLGIVVIIGAGVQRLRFDADHVSLGVSFTPTHAAYLGLDPRATFERMLTDLKPDIVRIPAQWDVVEPSPGAFSFADLDWYLATAAQRGVDVVVVAGQRTPRWPECHLPMWVSSLSDAERQQALKNFLTVVVEHVRAKNNLVAWQVENEPLLQRFGVCPPPDRKFLQEEIALVHQFDPVHPVMITDSGELSMWRATAGLGDVFGSTLYRSVYSPRVHGTFSYWFVPPVWYRLKAALNHISLDRFVISELQAEPWFATPTSTPTPVTPTDIIANVSFARATGAQTILLWGVEYWYAESARGNPTWVTAARQVFAQTE